MRRPGVEIRISTLLDPPCKLIKVKVNKKDSQCIEGEICKWLETRYEDAMSSTKTYVTDDSSTNCACS